MADGRRSIERKTFGILPGGEPVTAVTLACGRVSVRVLTYGATIQSFIAPDRGGALADVALGHATIAEYLAHRQFFGATVGRVANRIAGGRFKLDGEEYKVPANDGPNALHGGPDGFDRRNWTVVDTQASPLSAVTLRLVSPHGDQGFPGELTATARFELDQAGGLHITYSAITGRPTLVNLSNHTYWNLAGEGADGGAMGQMLAIPAETYLPTDATSIPTGEFAPVAGTPFDFRQAMAIGGRVRDGSDEQIRIGRGYDHNWVIGRVVAEEPRLIARALDPRSGRLLTVHSDQPGVQFYSGNSLDGSTSGKSGRLYRVGDGFALEPQMFPDTPNHPGFGSLRLDPGRTYRNRILFRLGVADAAR